MALQLTLLRTGVGGGGNDDIIITDYTVSFGMTWKDIIFIPFYRSSMYVFLLVVYCSIAIATFVITFQPTGYYYNEILFHVSTALDLIYMTRTFLAILHRIYREHRRRKIFPPDPTYLLIIDAITLLPLGPYCFLINHFNWYDPFDYRIGYYYSFGLKLPRIVRLYFLYAKNYADLARHPRTIILYAHAILSSLLILIFSALYYTVYYYSPNSRTWADPFPGMKRHNVSYQTPILCFLFAGGFFYKDILTPMPYYSIREMALAACTILTGYLCHSFFLTSNLIAIYVQLMRYKHFFEWRLQKVGTYIKLLCFEQNLQDAINTYYRTIWIKRGGFVEQPEIVELFPLQLKTEIAMDLYFDAIRHAKIFCHLNESFKKEVSLLFQTEVFIPGQLMFSRNKLKSKLVYVHSGIVEVMSNENRDSPVLSFSPGTVLGEISCLMPYMCTADIKCSTTCVAHVLRHRDLNMVISKDYTLESTMRDTINRRIEYARAKLNRMRRLEAPISHIYWIKYRWRQLAKKKGKPNKAALVEPLSKHYCSRYLSLLVISSYYELKVHSICIRGKCSFVMEQETTFRKFLDIFCLICVVLHCFITFHLVIFVGAIPPQVFALLSLFDLVYLLDIYFQAITAVRVHNVFITKPMEILLHKCKQFRFLLDVFASLPFDYFALLMEASPYYVGLSRLPKYIKLIKIIEVLGDRETLKISTRSTKTLVVVAIHGFLILLCTCFMYMQTCFNNQCRKDGWLSTFKTKIRADFGDKLDAPDFVISLIYTCSIYLQMKIHHVQPAYIIELLTQFIIGVCGFYFLTLTIVQMSGSIALENYSRFLYIFNLGFLDSIFQERPEIRQYRDKVHDFISLQWVYSHAIQYTDIVTLMNHKSKFVRHKVVFEYAIFNLRKTQLFEHMSDTFLNLIASYMKLYVIPVGHTLQRPHRSAAELYVILDGYCKVQSYAPEDLEKGNTFFYTKFDVFPVVGFFQNVDSFLHVRTYTAVKAFAISYHDFLNCIRASTVDGAILLETINSHMESHKNLILRIVHLPLLSYPKHHKKNVSPVDIFDYKDENKKLSWKKVQKLSLRQKMYHKIVQTYDPNSKSYMYYEILHSLVILLEMLTLYLSLHRFIRLSLTYSSITISVLVVHAIDLFVRSHVHYFTDEGIRVTNLKATFINYINHSFVIDLISGLPYEHMQVFEIFRGRNPKNLMNVIFSLIVQPLKLYRVFSLLDIVRKTNGIQYHNVILAMSYTLAFFVFFSELAAFALVFTCKLNDNWYWECPTDSWLHHVNNFEYWYKEDLLYSRTYYEVINFHVMRSSKYVTYHDFLLFFFLGICNTVMYVKYLSLMVGYTAYTTKYLVNFQERRRRYNTFASRASFPKYLRDDLMEHYKYLYKKTQTDDSSTDTISSFYPFLQESLQVAMYVPTLQEAKIFLGIPMHFFRFIVPYISEHYYVMNATILRCNDINKYIYFVKKGYAEIFIADQSVAVLSVGGMFGCFNKIGTSRATINVVAKVHADLLAVETFRFYEVIRPYVQIVTAMAMADMTGKEYIESFQTHDSSFSVKRNRFARCNFGNWYRYTFDDRNGFIIFYRYITEMHIAPLVSIVALVMIVTVSGDDRYAKYWALVDVYFLFDMYMTCHIGTTDQESGLTTMRVRELTIAYIKSWKFYLDLITLIPFYYFDRWIPFKHNGILLLNKSFRIANMFVYYRYLVRSRYLPNHMRFTFLVYMLAFCLNAICVLVCISLLLLRDRPLTHREVVSYYLYVANIFTTAGMDPPEVKDFSTFLYISGTVILSELLFVLINVGCCKLAIMAFYQDMEFRRAVITFKAYCHNEYVSKPIVTQCWKYLMYLYSKHGSEQFPSLITRAPYYILEAHMAFIAKDLIHPHPLFRFAHEDFMRQLMRYLEYEFIMPGFTIVEAGDKRRRMYFIAEGVVLSITIIEGGNKQYALMRRGASFGEMQAIKGYRYPTTYKALTPVQVFGLRTKDWGYLLKWFPATEKTMIDASKKAFFSS